MNKKDKRPLKELHPHKTLKNRDKDYNPEYDVAASYKEEDAVKDYCDLPASKKRSGLGKFIDKFKDVIDQDGE